MGKTLSQFLSEKVDDVDEFADIDCECYDDLTDEEKKYCDAKKMLKYLKDFTIANS